MRHSGALLVVALSDGVLLRLRERLRESSPVARRMLVPVLAMGCAEWPCSAWAWRPARDATRRWAIEAVAWSLALAPPAIALAFLVALLRWRL